MVNSWTRGTTPTLTFTFQFPCADIDKLHLSFEQRDKIILEKKLSDFTIDGNSLVLRLTEADTLAMRPGQIALQFRGSVGGNKIASRVITTTVERIIKDGYLDDITG